MRVRAALGTSRYGHHTGSKGAPHTSEGIKDGAMPVNIIARPQRCFPSPSENRSLDNPIAPRPDSLIPRLTGQVLLIHAVTGRLHCHLQHSDAAVIRRQHDLVGRAPVDVENAVIHIAADAHAADHLDLRRVGGGGRESKVVELILSTEVKKSFAIRHLKPPWWPLQCIYNEH